MWKQHNVQVLIMNYSQGIQEIVPSRRHATLSTEVVIIVPKLCTISCGCYATDCIIKQDRVGVEGHDWLYERRLLSL